MLNNQDFRRRRGQGRHAGNVRQAAHQGLHHQSHADAQGRDHRLRAFARDVLRAIPDRPISFEVFSDDFDEMERRRTRSPAGATNVYVKIPITNTRREPSTR